MKSKRLLCMLFVLCLTIGALMLNASAADVVATGTSGETFTWTLDSDGVLTITGEGDMPDEISWRSYNMQVKSVVLSSGITSIYENAFADFYNMTAVSIPDTVQEIGSCAFNNCFLLKEVTIPEGVAEIREYTFSGCYKLKEVRLPYYSLTEIEPWAFYSCSELVHISIPAGVTSIGERAFGDGGLMFIYLPASVTEIGENAFSTEGILNHVYYEGTQDQWNAMDIGEKNENLTGAFFHYEAFGMSVTYQSTCWFTKYACTDCWGLIAETPHEPPTHTFTNGVCTRCQTPEGLQYDAWWDAVVITGYTGTLTNLVIPEDIAGRPVTTIDMRAFQGNLTLQTVTLPDTVESIGEAAFSGCRNLRSCNIPERVTTIGAYTFYDCYQLTEVTFPENLTSLGEFSFWGAGIVDLVLPDGIEEIPAEAFRYNNKLKTVKLPANLKTIGAYAFSGNYFTSIELPVGLEEIGDSAFQSTSLTSIEIPDTVHTIGMHAFHSTKLTSVVIPDSVTNFSHSVFAQCEELVSAKLPDFYEAIPMSTFSACFKLKDFQFPKALQTIDMTAFATCYGFTDVTIPATVTHIGDMAFINCTNLKTMTFEGDAPSFGNMPFMDDTLEIRYPAGESWEQARQMYTFGGEITWKPISSLSIVTQPKTTYTKLNATAKVTVKAEGDGLTYTWYFKNAGSSKFSKSSVTSATYSVKMTDAVKNRQVYCVVKDQNGNTVQTDTVYLRQAASIVTQPKTTYTKLGGTAKVTVKASGDGLTYTWYFKNAGSTKFSKSSVTAATYSAKMTDKVKNRQVYCVVKDKYGKTVTTETVYLRQAASIVTQPKTTYTKLNGTAKVTVKASGDGLTYTWYFKNAGASKFRKSSITSATYTTKMTSTQKDRQVYCVVKDKYGKTVTTETVYLRLAASIVTQPKTTYTKLGGTAKVTVKASGDGLTYTWYFKNAGASKFSKSSITSTTYTTKMTSTQKDRQVYCVVKDKYGNEIKTSTVYLRQAASIVTQPKTTYTKLGGTAKVTVKASGDGLTYTWYFKNAGSTKFTKSSVTSATYSTKMTSTTKDRYVYCVVKDKYGNTVKTETVRLRMAASISKQPVNVTVVKGAKATVKLTAKGDGLTYKWYYKDAGSKTFKLTTSFKGASYSTTMNADRSGRQVYCVVTDKYGNTVKSSVVTLNMQQIYVSENGARYHYSASCAGKSAYVVTLEEALAMGKTPCAKCVH